MKQGLRYEKTDRKEFQIEQILSPKVPRWAPGWSVLGTENQCVWGAKSRGREERVRGGK